MKFWQLRRNKLQPRWWRHEGVAPCIFVRDGLCLILITLMLAGCGRDGQIQPAPEESPGVAPTPTIASAIAPTASGDPQVKQVVRAENENSPKDPVTATSPLTVAAQITLPEQITQSDQISAPVQITVSTQVTISQQITVAGLLSMTAPLTQAAMQTPTVDIITVTDLSAQLGMTITRSLTDSVTITRMTVISDAFTSPLPAPPTTVLLPTPTPSPDSAPRSPSSALPLPTSDGVVRSARVPILMYHYLSAPPADADIYRTDLSVTPARFAAHLDAMQAAGYTTIRLYDLLDHLVQGAPLPNSPVVITFDDGYRDNYENAFPLLHARGMTASFFVVTDFTNEERPIYMTWDMLREMADGGMDIESHARNHVSLKNKDIDYLVWQALGSLESIEREIGVRPRFVSYPAGEYDRQTMDLFHSANYWAGLTTVQGATQHSDDLFQLHRVRVRGTTTPEELLRLLELDW